METWKKCVFVVNVDASISDAVFESYFRNHYYGVQLEPEKPRIIRDEFGRSKGFGFVYFNDSLSADRVVSKRYHTIDGKRVICKLASSKKRNPIISRNLHMREPVHVRQLFVRNLNVSTTEQQLLDYFLKLTSDVIKVFIKLDENNKSICYGFVTFRKSSTIDLVQERRPHKINNQEILTTRCYPPNVPVHLRRHSTVLFVSNYNQHVEKDIMEKYFEDFGNITSISYTTKRSEGIESEYMELHFADYDDVDKICLAGDEHTITKHCTVTVKKCFENDSIKTNNTQIETQRALGPSVERMEVSTMRSGRSENSFQSFPPNAPILSPVLPLDDLQQSPFNPYFLNSGQVLCPSFESRATNSQRMSSQNSLDRGEVDCCECCIIS